MDNYSTKPVLMIHEVREWMFDLPLDQYVLTFDDGLYSQYCYFDRFAEFNTEMIFFISSGIVCPEQSPQSTSFPCCTDAHTKAFGGVYEDYMKPSQLLELSEHHLVEIGGHSHAHNRLTKLTQFIDDTHKMLAWFDTTLGIKLRSFCYPYNDAGASSTYATVLKTCGITRLYGAERTPIEELR